MSDRELYENSSCQNEATIEEKGGSYSTSPLRMWVTYWLSMNTQLGPCDDFE
jgi:hypothetical protein